MRWWLMEKGEEGLLIAFEDDEGVEFFHVFRQLNKAAQDRTFEHLKELAELNNLATRIIQ